MVEPLLSLLLAGAKLIASSAAGEFSKGAGKTAFEAIRARLFEKHQAKSIVLLDDATTNPAYTDAIRSDLTSASIDDDAELKQLAETLRQAIASLPKSVREQYAIEDSIFQSKSSMTLEKVEGISKSKFTADGPIDIRNVSSPGKK